MGFYKLTSIRPIDLKFSIGQYEWSLPNNYRDKQKNTICGIYMFICNITNEVYIGSSVDLAVRIRYYLKPWNPLINKSIYNKDIIKIFYRRIYK